jgi:hypothetical protein
MYASIEPEVVKDDGTPVDEKKVLPSRFWNARRV